MFVFPAAVVRHDQADPPHDEYNSSDTDMSDAEEGTLPLLYWIDDLEELVIRQVNLTKFKLRCVAWIRYAQDSVAITKMGGNSHALQPMVRDGMDGTTGWAAAAAPIVGLRYHCEVELVLVLIVGHLSLLSL